MSALVVGRERMGVRPRFQGGEMRPRYHDNNDVEFVRGSTHETSRCRRNRYRVTLGHTCSEKDGKAVKAQFHLGLGLGLGLA